jgi:signal peptide peptidase SppA
MITEITMEQLQIINGTWLMEPQALSAFAEKARMTQAKDYGARYAVSSTHKNSETDGDTATIYVNGVLMKSVPAWVNYEGIEATGYDTLNLELMMAADDPAVKRINLVFDTPGGQVAGQIDVAKAIAEINQTKPITAYISDMCCSGGYWLASQCGEIFAKPNSAIGSIGVYCTYYDMSKMAEDAGIKVLVISSGELKGMGVPGAPISEKQIADMQKYVDALGANFVDAVSVGRNKNRDEVAEWATGAIWETKESLNLGLIDGILDNSISLTKRNSAMAESPIDVSAAIEKAKAEERERFTQLQAAFPDETDFVVKQFAAGASVEAAKAAYCDVVTAKLKVSEDEKAAKAAKEKEDAAKAASGATPVSTSGTPEPESSGDFMTLAREMAEEKKIGMTAAMKQLAKEQPELHAAFINKNKKQ